MARDTLATGNSRKYIAHPTAGSGSSFVSDGKPLDAGTYHILSNNCAVLLAESPRHLFTDVIGDVSKATDRGWDNLDEDEPPSADRSATGSYDLIAWNLLGTPTARRYGPFTCVLDRSESSSAGLEYYPRKVSMRVRYYSDGTHTFTVYVVITPGPLPPTEGVIAANTTTCATTSAADQDNTVTLQFAETTRVSHTAGSTSARGGGQVQVPEFWIWIGWDADAITGTAGIRSVSAWEILT